MRVSDGKNYSFCLIIGFWEKRKSNVNLATCDFRNSTALNDDDEKIFDSIDPKGSKTFPS